MILFSIHSSLKDCLIYFFLVILFMMFSFIHFLNHIFASLYLVFIISLNTSKNIIGSLTPLPLSLSKKEPKPFFPCILPHYLTIKSQLQQKYKLYVTGLAGAIQPNIYLSIFDACNGAGTGDNPPVGKPLASPRGGYRIITTSVAHTWSHEMNICQLLATDIKEGWWNEEKTKSVPVNIRHTWSHEMKKEKLRMTRNTSCTESWIMQADQLKFKVMVVRGSTRFNTYCLWPQVIYHTFSHCPDSKLYRIKFDSKSDNLVNNSASPIVQEAPTHLMPTPGNKNIYPGPFLLNNSTVLLPCKQLEDLLPPFQIQIWEYFFQILAEVSNIHISAIKIHQGTIHNASILIAITYILEIYIRCKK
ncbi:hypothetical protein VP01_2219g2 [Puccinia sorghi]|uniref:Uncharacterized protein n=1 Tax=Puccinia sorghi TaxID=27349 RepID=A0A0L6V9E4_9BASI|nr:hypothetical protein VP01_2219g2 [Puccinia sorghi]